MRTMIKTGVFAAAFIFAGNTLAAELETEAQKLGYVFGMEIGGQLKQGGAEVDIDTLTAALKASYLGQDLALTPEEATAIRNEYIAARRAEAEAAQQNLAATNAAACSTSDLASLRRLIRPSILSGCQDFDCFIHRSLGWRANRPGSA